MTTPLRIPLAGSGDVIDTSKPPYNVLPGVTPNPEVQIQVALLQAKANIAAGSGPGAVRVPAGTYSGMDLYTIPGQASVAASIYVPSGVAFFAHGVVGKLKVNATLPAGANQGHIVSNESPYASSLGSTISNTHIEGITVDGNAANQTPIAGTAVASALTLGAANAGVAFTAVAVGSAGNSLNVILKNPAAPSAALSVVVSGRDITVNLATNGSSVVTSTAGQVVTAINGSGPASALLTASNVGDGSGTIIPTVRTWLSGGTGNTQAVTCGIFTGSVENAWVVRCVVKNVYGNDTSPPGETFHLECNHSHNVTYWGCVADGAGSLNTATGFSADVSQNVTYVGCTGRNMGSSHGFTHYQCADIAYTACKAYGNLAGAGFNSEISDVVTYTACLGGSRALTTTSGTAFQFYPTGGAVLGNKYGFLLQGSTNVKLDPSCEASGNQWNLRIRDANYGVGNPLNRAGDRVRVSGGIYTGSVGAGGDGSQDILVDLTTTNWAAVEVLKGGIEAVAAGTGAARVTMGSQVADVASGPGNNGRRFYSLLHTRTAAGHAYRWLYESASGTSSVALRINGLGQLVTQGRARTPRAVSGSYTIVAMDDLILVDTTAARALTLPTAASVEPGMTVTIKDATGTAATNNITIGKAGSDQVEGAGGSLGTSYVVNANFGKVTLVSDGTSKWLVL